MSRPSLCQWGWKHTVSFANNLTFWYFYFPQENFPQLLNSIKISVYEWYFRLKYCSNKTLCIGIGKCNKRDQFEEKLKWKMESKDESLLCQLPEEILINILSYLSYKDRCILAKCGFLFEDINKSKNWFFHLPKSF